MKTMILVAGTVISFAATVSSFGQSVVITAATRDGRLTWTNPYTSGAATILVTSNPVSGPWFPSRHLLTTGNVTTAQVAPPQPTAAFYRIQVDDVAAVPPGWALVPAGTFQMGDNYSEGAAIELPVHPVFISGFIVDKFETTNEKMRQVMQWALEHGLIGATEATVTNREGLSRELLDFDGHDHEIPVIRVAFTNGVFSIPSGMENLPVTGVTWYGAQAYCNYLSDMEGLPRCINFTNWTCDFARRGYRLPTEVEWEKAARGGLTGHHYPWESYGGTWSQHISANQATSSINNAGPFGNWWTSPVGFYNGQIRYKPDYGWPGAATTYQTVDNGNGYGIYDMAGNVWEWCWDYWQADWYSNPAARLDDTRGPVGPVSGRAIRGGGKGYYEDKMRCACRYNMPWAMAWASPVVGFRAVRGL